ncbi:unnamed protein product [Scytosiphon promiscuus]
MSYSHNPTRAGIDDEGEAFARAVFYRFLRQATICRDIDDVIEHMHIINDDSRTYDIRLGGEARVPVSRELILALATKKKELLRLCESTLTTPRSLSGNSGGNGTDATGTSGGGGGGAGPGLSSSLQHYRQQGQAGNTERPRSSVVFPPPAALAAIQSAATSPGSVSVAVPVGRCGNGSSVEAANRVEGDGRGGVDVDGVPASAPAGGGAPRLGTAVPAPVGPAVVVGHSHEEARPLPPPSVVVPPTVVADGPGAGLREGRGLGSGGGSNGCVSGEAAAAAGGERRGGTAEQHHQQQQLQQTPSAAAPAFVPAAVAAAEAAAAAATTTAAAGWSGRGGDSAGQTTLFVRKIDMKSDRDDIIKHFSRFGRVLSVSMNNTRGYAFVDLDSHASVLRAVSMTEHRVGHKNLQVEVKKEPDPKDRRGVGNNNISNTRQTRR